MSQGIYLCSHSGHALDFIEIKRDATKLRCKRCPSSSVKLVGTLWQAIGTTNETTAKANDIEVIRAPVESGGGLDRRWVWAFTDGSASGAAACIMLSNSASKTEWKRQEFTKAPGHTKPRLWNVAGEMDAVLLALKHAPKCSHLTVVSDYTGSGLWGAGRWKIKDPDVLVRIECMRHLIRLNSLSVRFIHVKGHASRGNGDLFTKYNHEADALVSKVANTKAHQKKVAMAVKKIPKPLPGGPCDTCGGLTEQNPEHQAGCVEVQEYEFLTGQQSDLTPEGLPTPSFAKFVDPSGEILNDEPEECAHGNAAHSCYLCIEGDRPEAQECVGIVGSRDYPELELVVAYVRKLPKNTTVVSGGARGVDNTAQDCAIDHGYKVITHRPKGDKPGAWHARNSLIVRDSDRLVAFIAFCAKCEQGTCPYNGYTHGTMDTIKKAHTKGIPIEIFDEKGEPTPVETVLGIASGPGEGTYFKKTAHISDDGVYRFSLVRVWDERKPRLLFVMLNPSTANADQDDPTIRKCVGFAKRLGYGSIEVVNLYAYRATDPKDLWAQPAERRNVPENDKAIRVAAGRAQTIVCAWGAHSRELARESEVLRIIYELTESRYCLGVTTKGKPCHPLMLPYETKLVPFQSRKPETLLCHICKKGTPYMGDPLSPRNKFLSHPECRDELAAKQERERTPVRRCVIVLLAFVHAFARDHQERALANVSQWAFTGSRFMEYTSTDDLPERVELGHALASLLVRLPTIQTDKKRTKSVLKDCIDLALRLADPQERDELRARIVSALKGESAEP